MSVFKKIAFPRCGKSIVLFASSFSEKKRTKCATYGRNNLVSLVGKNVRRFEWRIHLNFYLQLGLRAVAIILVEKTMRWIVAKKKCEHVPKKSKKKKQKEAKPVQGWAMLSTFLLLFTQDSNFEPLIT